MTKALGGFSLGLAFAALVLVPVETFEPNKVAAIVFWAVAGTFLVMRNPKK